MYHSYIENNKREKDFFFIFIYRVSQSVIMEQREKGDGGGTASILKTSAEFVMQQYNKINNFSFSVSYLIQRHKTARPRF